MNREEIRVIELALGFKLLPFQIAYIKGYSDDLGTTRGSGRTTAYCIKIALSDGEPLYLDRIHEFADMKRLGNHRTYASHFFKNSFMDIHTKLKAFGLKVREVKTHVKSK